MPIAPLFQGKRLRITSLRPEDVQVVTEWYERGDFGRLWDSGVAYPRSEEQANFIVRADANAYKFAIRLKDDLLANDTLIGYMDIDSIQWNNGSAWVSIAIGDPQYQGKGYGEEATRLLLHFAFAELNLHRVQLTVFRYNERAVRLYERLGFVLEGTYREYLHRDGARHDMLLYGLLRREWESQVPST